MKKYICLLPLLVIVILLSACTDSQADPITSVPDSLSSTPTSSVPPTDASTSPTDAPTSPTETEPTEPPLVQLSTDWVIEDRTFLPFEERFENDLSFTGYGGSWFVQISDNTYCEYSLSKSKGSSVLNVRQNETVIYQFRSDRDLSSYSLVTGDGQWAYLSGENQLIRMDLLTGESTTLEEFSPDLLKWYIWNCDQDMVFIYTLDQDYRLHYYYKDLRSGATKTMYEGTIPATPLEDMVFYRPGSTQSPVCWRMMNPDFYEVLKKELSDPESPFRTMLDGRFSYYWDQPEKYSQSIEGMFFLCLRIQDHYGIPARVKYYYDYTTGELTPDYGIICDCERGSDKGHDPFDYEITKEEVPEILDVAPVELPNIIKLTNEQAEAAQDISCEHYRYSDDVYTQFGLEYPAIQENGIYTKLADIPITQMVLPPDYAYCITLDNTIIQLSYDGSVYNTIYTSDSKLNSLCYWAGCLYFRDNDTIIRIDTINGTWQPILRSTLKEFFVSGEGDGGLSIAVRQGMYYQAYFFYLETGELEEDNSL